MTIPTSLARLADMFAYPLRHSHYVELVNPLWTTHKLMARVVAVQQETADSRTLTLRPGSGWRSHRAGQFVRLGVPIDGQRHTRTYSISSAPARDDGCITVTVKAVPGGRVSQHLVQQVQVGEYLPLGEPQGEFVLPESM
ncbi:MAG: ferredoxin reductase, partial [Burkholderiaceae bacterium]|nr:ferredoxin reductase [Burkholderiaceae bacterium]